MQLRLRTKLTLVMTGLVLLGRGRSVLSGVIASAAPRSAAAAGPPNKRADELDKSSVSSRPGIALLEAGQRGLRAGFRTLHPWKIHDFVRHAI